MVATMTRLLRGWADAALRSRLAALETQLEQERARVRILATCVEQQAEVIERDRSRIAAETAAYTREKVRS